MYSELTLRKLMQGRKKSKFKKKPTIVCEII